MVYYSEKNNRTIWKRWWIWRWWR